MPYKEVNGKTLFYVWKPAKDDGDLKDPRLTLVFIHGLGSSSSFYAPLIPGLAAAGFSCLAIDTYGSCQSEYTGQNQDIRSIAEDVACLLSALDVSLKQTVIVGHSMGGIVACDLASRHEVAGVVLIGPVLPDPATTAAFEKRIETVKLRGMEEMADTIPVTALGSKSTKTQQAFVRALILSQSTEGYISLCDVIAKASPPDFSQMKSPLLVIAGQEDKVAPFEGSQKIINSWGTKEVRPKLEVLEGVGHWHCIEAAEKVGIAIYTFVKDVLS